MSDTTRKSSPSSKELVSQIIPEGEVEICADMTKLQTPEQSSKSSSTTPLSFKSWMQDILNSTPEASAAQIDTSPTPSGLPDLTRELQNGPTPFGTSNSTDQSPTPLIHPDSSFQLPGQPFSQDRVLLQSSWDIIRAAYPTPPNGFYQQIQMHQSPVSMAYMGHNLPTAMRPPPANIRQPYSNCAPSLMQPIPRSIPYLPPSAPYLPLMSTAEVVFPPPVHHPSFIPNSQYSGARLTPDFFYTFDPTSTNGIRLTPPSLSDSPPFMLPQTPEAPEPAIENPSSPEGKYTHQETWGKDPKKPWLAVNPTLGKNSRQKRRQEYVAEEHYAPLAQRPTSWNLFSYEVDGELKESTSYSVAGVEHFLRKRTPSRALIIWIQRHPPDSGNRWRTPTSHYCRFRECCAPTRVIGRGQYRVCFDELTTVHSNHDPNINAGYVHLYCIEKFLDFPALCQDLDVRVDSRILPKEPRSRNGMMLGTSNEVLTAQNFVRHCRTNGRPPPDYPRYNTPNRPHEGTLTHQLSVTKYASLSDSARKQQNQRGLTDTSGAVHLGNLEAMVAANADRTRNRKEEKSKMRKRGKRKAEEEGGSDEGSISAPVSQGALRAKKRRT